MDENITVTFLHHPLEKDEEISDQESEVEVIETLEDDEIQSDENPGLPFLKFTALWSAEYRWIEMNSREEKESVSFVVRWILLD